MSTRCAPSAPCVCSTKLKESERKTRGWKQTNDSFSRSEIITAGVCIHSLCVQSLHCWIWCSPLRPPPVCLKVSASAKRGSKKSFSWQRAPKKHTHTHVMLTQDQMLERGAGLHKTCRAASTARKQKRESTPTYLGRRFCLLWAREFW